MSQIKQESSEYEDQNLNSGLVENVHVTISHEPMIKSETLEKSTEEFDLNQEFMCPIFNMSLDQVAVRIVLFCKIEYARQMTCQIKLF